MSRKSIRTCSASPASTTRPAYTARRCGRQFPPRRRRHAYSHDRRHPELALQVAQEQKDLDLDRGVEGRGWLIREQQSRLQRDGERDRRPRTAEVRRKAHADRRPACPLRHRHLHEFEQFLRADPRGGPGKSLRALPVPSPEICRPIVETGSSAVIGSWKVHAWRPCVRACAEGRGAKPARTSRPSHSIRPLVFTLGPGSSPMMLRSVTLLPHPDSPRAGRAPRRVPRSGQRRRQPERRAHRSRKSHRQVPDLEHCHHSSCDAESR